MKYLGSLYGFVILVAGSSLTPSSAFALPRAVAQFGGVPFAFQDFNVEVLASPNGFVQAVVSDGSNAMNLASLKLNVKMRCVDEGAEVAALRWDAINRVYAGLFENDRRPVSGPMTVEVMVGTKIFRMTTAYAAVIPEARYGGVVVGVGRYTFELLPHASGRIALIPRDDATLKAAKNSLTGMVVMPGVNHDTVSVGLRFDRERSELAGNALQSTLGHGDTRVIVQDSHGGVFEGRVESVTPLHTPRMGGFVLSTGSYTIEIAQKRIGQLDAIVFDHKGRPINPANVQLIVNATDIAGNVYPVVMHYNKSRHRYEGALKLPSQSVASYFAKVRGGDSVTENPYEAMFSLEGNVETSMSHGAVSSSMTAREVDKARERTIHAAPLAQTQASDQERQEDNTFRPQINPYSNAPKASAGAANYSDMPRIGGAEGPYTDLGDARSMSTSVSPAHMGSGYTYNSGTGL